MTDIDNFNNGPTIEKFRQCFSHLENHDLQTKMMYTFSKSYTYLDYFSDWTQQLWAQVWKEECHLWMRFTVESYSNYPAGKMKWISNPGILGDRSSRSHDL